MFLGHFLTKSKHANIALTSQELETALSESKNLLTDPFLKDVLVPANSQGLARKYSDRDLCESAREKCELACQKLSAVSKVVQKMQGMHQIQNDV